MTNRIATTLAFILFTCIAGAAAYRQNKDQNRTFNKRDYPNTTFNVTRASFPHGEVTIDVIQVKKRDPAATAPFICRAWLDIKKAGVLVKQLYLPEIEAVGGYYGLFVPRKQPSPYYFAIAKLGDYDGGSS